MTPPRRPKNKRPRSAPSGEVRVIGGEWRGRKARFPATPGLRPTPDRVRETLFNWLAPWIEGARCLDLFAGSGALGLEALSRGALCCEFDDRQREATRALADNLERFRCSAARAPITTNDALARLEQTPRAPVDIVFLDPPFGEGLVADCIGHLERHSWLAEEAFVYVEQAADDAPPAVPADWALYREKVSGDVSYRLYRLSAAAERQHL